MHHLLHFTNDLSLNQEGVNKALEIDNLIYSRCAIVRATHTYRILDMSQSTYLRTVNSTVVPTVVTTVLVEVLSKS